VTDDFTFNFRLSTFNFQLSTFNYFAATTAAADPNHIAAANAAEQSAENAINVSKLHSEIEEFEEN